MNGSRIFIFLYFFQLGKGGKHFLCPEFFKIDRYLVVPAALGDGFHDAGAKFDMLYGVSHLIVQRRRLCHSELLRLKGFHMKSAFGLLVNVLPRDFFFLGHGDTAHLHQFCRDFLDKTGNLAEPVFSADHPHPGVA